MADQTLTEALSGLNVRGIDTPWGIGALTLGQNAGSFINPYGSWGSNLAIGLGTSLLTALLGYQAKQSALEQNLALQPGITAALKATSMEDLDRIMAQPEYQRLGTIGTELKTSLLARQAAAAEKANEFKQALQLTGLKEMGYMPAGMENIFTPSATLGTLTPKQEQELSFQAALEKQKRDALAPIKQKEDEIKMSLELGQRAAQNPVVKKYQDLNLFNQQLQQLAQKQNITRPDVDRMIVLFNKMTDPTSVTTLGEFYMAEKMQSALDQYKANLGNLISSNPRLQKQAVQEVVSAANTIMGAAGNAYNDQVLNFVQQGRELGTPSLSPSKLGLPLHGIGNTQAQNVWEQGKRSGITTPLTLPENPTPEEIAAFAELERRKAARGN